MNRAGMRLAQAGQQIWRTHVEALHGLMDGLLKRYPHLSIQSCSSGGGRADAAMLARCCQVWTSDNTDALDRIRIQDGYTLHYPTSTMECWVTHTVNHQTHRNLSLDLRFSVAMRGVLGIGSINSTTTNWHSTQPGSRCTRRSAIGSRRDPPRAALLNR